MASPPSPPSGSGGGDQRWPWWPLLPLYPYGRRATLVRELLPDQVWSFEQLHGIWYVAVPIRMTVVKVNGGLMLYAPIAPTQEVVHALKLLEEKHGPICSIVLPTASGLEHKVPVPAMARCFPAATLWVSDCQWSFPVGLPSPWLGFPPQRTRVLGCDGYPHADQLDWVPLGPLDLGLGTFLEVACRDRSSGALLVTDALVSFQADPPATFALDPTPLLFHGRECGAELLLDTEENRRKGWKRILLFANFFRPSSIRIPGWQEVRSDLLTPGNRNPRSHFGLYPFRWSGEWEEQAQRLITSCAGEIPFTLAPVLERLVLVRAKETFAGWLRDLADLGDIRHLIGAHYHAPQAIDSHQLRHYAESIPTRQWAPSGGAWETLAKIDETLLRWGVVPKEGEAIRGGEGS